MTMQRRPVDNTILIFRIGSIGDTVMALPCFHQIARVYPNANRVVISDIPASQKATSVEGVLDNSGLIHDAIYFPPSPRTFRDFLDLRSKIQSSRAKTLIYLADRDIIPTMRDLYFFRFCGIRNVIGAPTSRNLRDVEVDPVTGIAESETRRLARCIASLGPIDLDSDAMWDMNLQPREQQVAERALAPLAGGRFIACNVGGKIAIKDWGDDNWLALLRRMAAGGMSNYALVFFGSADELDRCSRLTRAWPGATLNLCGELTPRESAAAMSRAQLFLGHDSGPMHLAAAVGVRCVCMFGKFNKPKTWYPRGTGHLIAHDMRGVENISPEDVYTRLRTALAEFPGGKTTDVATDVPPAVGEWPAKRLAT